MAENEITERQAADILKMKSETLRYHRVAGWLADGICREAEKPPLQVRPNIRYDLDRLTALVKAGKIDQIYRKARPA